MAELYATLIIRGSRTYQDVPKLIRNKVKQILIDSGLEELAQE